MSTQNVPDKIPTHYASLTPRLMLQLAAPHTWPAAILPVLLAVVLTILSNHTVSLALTLVLLVICILMQATVNTLNDYYDFVKGTDSMDNQDDPTDAVLVYNSINPRSTLFLSIIFLTIAFLLGGYVIFVSGWIPLLIGIIGAAMIILYSAGKSPLSYLPVGEYISGFTMGGLIPLASYYSLTGVFSWEVLLLSLPLIIGIGLIMFTNNTCDIEKDIEAGRKTQSVLLGRKRSRNAYHATIVVWIVAIIILTAVYSTKGLIVVPFMLLVIYPLAQGLFKNLLVPTTRGAAMGSCLSLNITLSAFYFVCLLAGRLVTFTF